MTAFYPICKITLLSLCCLFFMSHMARADWILDKENSNLSFGSIKNNTIGESNYFNEIDGRVTGNGEISLLIELNSIETWVDIRNDRMKTFFFETDDFPLAQLRGQIDMTKFAKLGLGSQQIIEVAFDLSLHGHQQTVETELVVIRVSQEKIIVVPNEIIFLDLEEFDLLSGLKKLQELAKLPIISSSVPITFNLTFLQIP